ncbi:MAG TPA: phosphoribosylformylglycinamidine synthase subunit PurL [Baekduia sp.]|uniref:phosphoribosylformylglycinamidine synthase subunit PurL n=1 Tax=Baekduia sp. TaxID=2600305 RepID=UPI002CF37586|nr:phosphoribosylformylglycinamidine synthase subunit PurL [Baekduia sp.]HMJ35738.1 phosphoribosylformylglycinamidine synthase subunit PurL [Baekduia sp.]
MSPSPETRPHPPVPGIEQAVALGLTRDEYAMVVQEMDGREPNEVELAMFSLLWSEHCAYKHSKKLLRTLPTEGPAVVMGPGENAGAVDVGGGWAVAFKVESHNHPSAVEPFQGAATGVGGILRDIFALGARPIAVLDSLRFGEPDSERSRYLLDRAVAGIGHYGNSIGVPTVGGEVVFEAPYETNCLVNAMAIGLARTEDMIRSAAAGVGNVLVLFGASTGRDGIGGASVLASAELDAEDESKRPSVQVGDPFEESKLLECSLALLQSGLLVALQDLGAAGLTSAASEMAAKGEVGLDLDVAKVPLREADMAPFEIMVSESQERMLCVCEPGKVADVLALCEKWEVNGTAIGEVTEGNRFRVLRGDEVVGDMPVSGLVDDAPLYDLAPEKPTESLYPAPAAKLGFEADVHEALVALLSSPNLASRRPLFEQYDSIVQSRTVRRPEEADAAVLHLYDMGDGAPAIATSIDGNGRKVAADPYWGTVANVLECAANLACVGAQPLGTTNNLNFGNPEKPHIAWQLTEAVRGLGDACRALEAPIVGGNVSLYNEGADGPIYPTPVVGMVGLLPDATRAGRLGFARAGDAIALVGWNGGVSGGSLAASELSKLRGEALPDGLPAIDLAQVVGVLDAVREAVRDGELSSVHDVAEGGFLVAVAESCLAGGLGAALDLGDAEDVWTTLFGERSGGFVVSGPRDALERLGERVPLDVFGTVGGDRLEIAVSNLGESWPLAELREASSALAPLFP